MDLNSLSVNDGPVKMTLNHPVTGEPLTHDGEEFYLEIYGRDSAVYKQALRDVQTEGVKDPEEASAKVFARITTGITVFENGKWVKKPDVERMFKAYPWMREQADRFVHNRANFMKG